ncbi:hypothetical protein JCM10450v2_005989 [Rhodotorula kratochvilovae]
MPKVQTHYLSTTGLKDKNVRHLSCEGCRKRKMKCSRTMPCVACEMRGHDCVWLDCKPAHGAMQTSLEENHSEIIRLEKIVKQLQALLVERDGRPYSLPPIVMPPTPPYNLDGLPLPSPPATSHVPRFYEVPGRAPHHAVSPSTGPSWTTPTRSFTSPSALYPSHSFHAPPASFGDEYRPSYDSTVSYATLLAPHPPAQAPPSNASPPASSPVWSAPHSRSSTWPSSAPAYTHHTGDSLFLPASSSSPTELESSSFRPAPSDLPPLDTSVAHPPGPSTVSALLNGVYAQVTLAEAQALGLSLDVSEEAKVEERAEWESLMVLPEEHA